MGVKMGILIQARWWLGKIRMPVRLVIAFPGGVFLFSFIAETNIIKHRWF
jgi:hypothetical protein